MAYTLFTVCAYVFMRAFEVLFADRKDQRWYRIAIGVVAAAVLYAAAAGMLGFYFNSFRALGFKPN